MIFATVGTQLPFPRLLDALNSIAPALPPILAQTGSDTTWENLTCREHLSPQAFDAAISACDLVVSHAGMGTLLKARAAGKPCVLVPRRAALREHRNDHQIDGAMALEGRQGIFVAWNCSELLEVVRTALEAKNFVPTEPAPKLVSNLRQELNTIAALRNPSDRSSVA